MDMTISKGQRDLLIGLAGVLIAVLCWFLVASPDIEKREALEAENAELRPKAEEYQAVHARVDEYKASITTLDAASDEIIKHYPSDVQREDQLMYWANIAASHPLNLVFEDIELGEWDAVAIAGLAEESQDIVTTDEEGNPVVADEDFADAKAEYKLYSATMAMDFGSTYEGIKDMLKYIKGQNDRSSIESINVYYDEGTGFLVGALGLRMYYLDGTGKEYQPQFIPTVPTGVEDVFRTAGYTYGDAIQDLAEAAAEAADGVAGNADKKTPADKDKKKDAGSETAYLRKGDATVYHTDRNCEYIKDREVDETTVEEAKKKYPKCRKCGN